MRYLFCSTLLLIILNHPGNSQIPIGVKVGIGLSFPDVGFQPNPYDGSLSSSTSKNGMVFGLITQLPLGSGFWLKPALQVSFKGFNEQTHSAYYGNYTFGHSVTYLELPVNLVYSSGKKGDGFQLGAGPVLGYLLNPNFYYYSLRRGDVGINALTGYQMPVGFSFALSYTHSFTDAVNNKNELASLKNRFAALTIGYLF